jgi:pimeloyl-ACP methyl ester carboxylesterase
MMRMEVRLPGIVSLVGAIGLLGGGCAGGGDEPTASDTRNTPGTTSTAEGIARSSEEIDIGGRSLHMQCWGEPVAGEPTVLIISGLGPPASSWELMASEFARDGHHLCAYDRAGVAPSDPAPEGRRTTEDQVADLVSLLDAADLPEPLVLVAHSLGSLPAVGLVDRASERVAGVVLVDPWGPRVSAAQRAALPPKKPDESPDLAEERRFVTEYLYDPAQNSENLHIAASDGEVTRLLDQPGPIFLDLPVVVLRAPPLPPVAGLPSSYEEVTVTAMSAGYREFAAESTRGTLIKVEDTGHNIQDDQPEVVMDAIRDVMAG